MARGNLLATVGTVGLMALSAIASAQSPAAPATAREDPAPSSWQVAPAWSPDGTRFITASMRGGQVDLWVTQADTGAATRWTDDSAVEGQPAWSPNGQCVAYVTTRNDHSEIDVKCADAPAWRLILRRACPAVVAGRQADSLHRAKGRPRRVSDVSGRERRERDPGAALAVE